MDEKIEGGSVVGKREEIRERVRRRKERGGRSTTPKNKMLEMGENKYDS
jgi:hypothetical protein